MIIPNPVGKLVSQVLGSLLFGGMIAGAGAVIYGQTAVSGGAILLPAFNSNGSISTTLKTPMLVPFDAPGTLTGSATVKVNGGVKYAAFCVPNPLTRLGTNYGSGILINTLSFQMGPNPQNASYDFSFEKSCNGGTGGSLIANNVQLASGATLTLSGGRLPNSWNGADYIKGATVTALTNATTTMRVRGFEMDVHGE